MRMGFGTNPQSFSKKGSFGTGIVSSIRIKPYIKSPASTMTLIIRRVVVEGRLGFFGLICFCMHSNSSTVFDIIVEPAPEGLNNVMEPKNIIIILIL